MEARQWVKDKFGTADVNTLLDESVYPKEDLRSDKAKLEQNLRRIENEQEKHRKRYEKLMKKGAGASDTKKRQYAKKAKFEKKKYNVKKKKQKAQNVKLGTVIAIEGMREVLSIHGEDEVEIDTLIEDMDTQELQGEIMDQMAQFGLEIEDMQQVQESLDIEVLDNDLQDDVSEEMELMQQMEANEISDEAVDLEGQVEETDSDLDLDTDIEDDTIDLDSGI